MTLWLNNNNNCGYFKNLCVTTEYIIKHGWAVNLEIVSSGQIFYISLQAIHHLSLSHKWKYLIWMARIWRLKCNINISLQKTSWILSSTIKILPVNLILSWLMFFHFTWGDKWPKLWVYTDSWTVKTGFQYFTNYWRKGEIGRMDERAI